MKKTAGKIACVALLFLAAYQAYDSHIGVAESFMFLIALGAAFGVLVWSAGSKNSPKK